MKARKEVRLSAEVVSDLQKGADAKFLSLKKYMEYVLIRQSKIDKKKKA